MFGKGLRRQRLDRFVLPELAAEAVRQIPAILAEHAKTWRQQVRGARDSSTLHSAVLRCAALGCAEQLRHCIASALSNEGQLCQPCQMDHPPVGGAGLPAFCSTDR